MSALRIKTWALALIVSIATSVAPRAADNSNAEALYGATGSSNWADESPAAKREWTSSTAELYADVMGASVTTQRMFRDSLPSIVDYRRSAHLVGNSYCGPDSRWVMWDTPFMSRDIRDGEGGYLGYKQTVSGFATGLSRMLGENAVVGLALGYDARKLTGQDGYLWRNKTDTFHTALYGGTAFGNLFVDAYAGYSRSWQRGEKTLLNATRNPTHANYNDTVLSAGLKLSYVWTLSNDVRITPAIGLDYSHVKLNGFNETGKYASGANLYQLLKVHDSNYDSLRMPITVSVNKTFSSNFLAFGGKCSMWTPEVRAGYVPQFGAKRTGVRYDAPNMGSPSSGAYNVIAKSTKFAGSYGNVGAGLKIKLRDKYIFALDYDYTFGSKYDNHLVTGTYGVSF